MASPAGYLALGGGGGAGSGNRNVGSGGAPGGGVTWIRAARIEGSGVINASGSAAERGDRAGERDGAGGGGGGGTIDLFTNELAFPCTGFEVRGGAGGNTSISASSAFGGGGGGGGGLVRFAGPMALDPNCSPSLVGGRPGFPETSPQPSERGMRGHFDVIPWREVPQVTAP